jgi:putative protein-disulfide isomerase
MAQQRALWYFADPMCSWCWGFAPVMSALRDAYGESLPLLLVMGGLRPGTTEPVTAEFRDEILHHWREAQRRTGQSFKFDGALPDDFVYDTERPSRAVITVQTLLPSAAFTYFKSVQAAFYAEGRDVTQPSTLAALAEHVSIDRARFLDRFQSDDLRRQTQAHFRHAWQAGVRGFPTVLLQRDSDYALLTHGYRPLAALRPTIDAWMTDAA